MLTERKEIRNLDFLFIVTNDKATLLYSFIPNSPKYFLGLNLYQTHVKL